MNETAKLENMIQGVDSAEAVLEGTLCYIRSTGEYYLPDRELTDEELLEIIDCNFRITINSQGWTQEKMEPKDFFTYSCFINAVDGSICGAYSLSGDFQ